MRIEWPSPRLPGEMTDEIIAWIPDGGKRKPWGYYPTLLSCCLVCSQWLPASRDQLFPHLYIGSAKRYDLFVSQVLPQHSMRAYLSRVRALTLTKAPNNPRGRSSIPFSYAFVGHLPNLTALDVNRGGVMTYLYRHPYTSLALSRFPSIREVELSRTNFPSFGDLRRTLTSLPNLTVLSMYDDVYWPVPTAELPPRLTHGASTSSRPKLVEFRYMWGGPEKQRALQLFPWLASTSTGSSLRRLVLIPLRTLSQTYEDLCGPAFIRTVALRVEELSLYMTFDNAYTNFLEHFVHLKVLYIRYDIVWDSTYLPPNAIPLLRLLPAPGELRELGFQINVWTRKVTTEDFNWLRDLDAELEQEHFHNLTKVGFLFKIDPDITSKGKIMGLTEGNLPKLSSRSPPILRIDVTVFRDPEDEVAPDADTPSVASSEWESDSQMSDETSD